MGGHVNLLRACAGNINANGQVGLLFIDYSEGSALQINGKHCTSLQAFSLHIQPTHLKQRPVIEKYNSRTIRKLALKSAATKAHCWAAERRKLVAALCMHERHPVI